MKTIYNIKAFCLILLGATSLTVNAQENTDNLNREMTLEREYDPSVQDANKVNTLPVVKEPEVRKMPIDYANYSVAADPEKEINLLPSGKVMTDMLYNKRRGYFNFGGGTYLNLNGDLGYHILSTEKDQLNLFFSHRSTNGNVKYLQGEEEKVKAKLNDNLGGLYFAHTFSKAKLDLGVKYGYTGFNYYGYDLNEPSISSFYPASGTPDMDTNQSSQLINIHAGVRSSEEVSLGYLLDIDFKNFSYKYAYSPDYDGMTENAFRAKLGLFSAFGGNQMVGVNGMLHYFNYSDPELFSSATSIAPLFENYAEVTLTPYYKITGDNWKVKLGANIMFTTGDYSKFFVSPDIAADVEVADKTVLYLKADGRIQSNSAYDISRINRYIDPSYGVIPSRTWLDATIGLKSGVAPGFWFTIFAGYKITDDDLFFNQSNSYGVNQSYWGNISQALLLNSKVFRGGAELKYAYQNLLDVSLKGVYNSWSVSEDFEAYGKPDLEMNAGIDIRPVDKVSVLLDYYLATGRDALVQGRELKMKNISELNLTGTYTFNDTFGAYIKLNNILFQKYEYIYGYPMQGFSAMVGVNINF
ncbi:MAG: TonB-dependent receptor [Tannerellaceae bacterium]|nr:TonB-dependent receptor [Tannerellaceae bacterium]